MSTTRSKNIESILKVIEQLLPNFGPYTSLEMVKAAFQGVEYAEVQKDQMQRVKLEVDGLLKEGVTNDDLSELRRLHQKNWKHIQQVMITMLEVDKGLSIPAVENELRALLSSPTLPEGQDKFKADLYAAGISELDKAFVFTTSRLLGAAALIKARVTPAAAFDVINQSRGDLIGSLPQNVKAVHDRIASIVLILVKEQKVSINDVKDDIETILTGKPSIYGFKGDYLSATSLLAEFVRDNMKGLAIPQFVLGFFTESFVTKLVTDIIQSREDEADELIIPYLQDHIKLPVGMRPTSILAADPNTMYMQKMDRAYRSIFEPWKQNNTYYVAPAPACPLVACPTLLPSPNTLLPGSNSNFKSATSDLYQMGTVQILMLGGLALAGYEFIVKPVGKTVLKACGAFGMLLFSECKDSKTKTSRNDKAHLSPILR